VAVRPVPPQRPPRRRAPLPRRLLARAIDQWIVLAGLLVVSTLVGGPERASPAAFALATVTVAAYEATLLRWWARTPGKALLGLGVTTVSGRRVSWPAGFLRTALLWGPLSLGPYLGDRAGRTVLVAVVVVYFGEAAWRDDGRSVHDLAAGTVVRAEATTGPAVAGAPPEAGAAPA
jgi:uncharacterized RDD family membrane protein YckC